MRSKILSRILEITEDELQAVLEQARHLEPKALAKLSQYCYPRIFRYIYYRVNNSADVEDLVSEVCLKMVRSIQSQNGSFDAWIFRVASNVVTDYYRRRAVRRTVEPINDSIEDLRDETNEIDHLLDQQELRQSMARLTDEQQQVILFKFIEGYENDEIAGMLGKSVEAVRALQFRALAALRKLLREERS